MDIKKQKQELLNQLYEPYKKCIMCPLAKAGRTNVIFGEGNPDANLMFVGEGPGKQEDKQAKPFVGKSGKLLTSVLNSAGIKREDIFITNIVKCRPPNNRKPFKKESFACKNLLLLKQIQIIQPRIICTLGSAALEGFLQKKVAITALRGTPLQTENFLILPTYHPAYILRNKNNLSFFQKDIQSAKNLASATQ